ncbi:MAG: biotin/lipoyl-binding protein, partial [Alphaproteobacteria bacterium]|nr:biotin/lipoyl-binding protein [Alphaproteobacteria bacterium]
MPDGADKKSEATPASQAAETSPTPGAASRRSLRLLVGGAIAVIAVLFGGREMYQRINFVYAEDSRIEADLITVSSRVAGWVTTLDVTEGAPISKGQVLLNIDARESTLRVAELDAQVAGLDAERERLAAERRMVDAQTASMYLSEKSQLEAARV